MKSVNLLISFLFLYGEINTARAEVKRREGLSLSEKYTYLVSKSLRKSILRINEGIFKDYVRTGPKNYSFVIMFTAMAPHRMCAICSAANDEFKIVANSFRYSTTFNDRLFFGYVDFDEGAEVFNLLKLNTAPTFLLFPPKGRPRHGDMLDIQRTGFSAEALAKWISDRTDVQIRVFRPPNYSGFIGFLMLLTIVIGFMYLWRNSVEYARFRNKTVWASISMFFTLAMISGQMWNHIRAPPFAHKGGGTGGNPGTFAYIHGSSQAQFVFETYIVFVLYGLMVAGMILMIEAAQKKGDPKKRKALAVTGLFFFVVFFSVLLVVFRSKAQGYPYSFLFK